MKRTAALLLGATAALAAPGCVPDAVSVQIQYAMSDQPNAACEVTMSSNQRGGGSVDLGNTSRYWTALKVVSALDASDLKAGGQTVNPGSRNNLRIEAVKIGYSVTNSRGSEILNIPTQTAGAAGFLSAGGSLALGMNLLTPDAVSRLNAYFDELKRDVRLDTVLTARVSIAFVGKLGSGGSYETAPFEFPLVVYKDDTVVCDTNPNTKAHWKLAAATGTTPPACSNFGQDGVPYSCVCADCGPCSAGTKCNTDTCACE
jgi:hypothetical protein